MQFDRLFLDEVAARNDIVDVVSRYVQLKKKGANYFGLCPFHSEKSPSFSVSPSKQIFHCFGCGVGGGVISFIRQIEGLEFVDAVQFLAERAGLELPTQSEAEQAAIRQRQRLLALCKDAARFFYHTLWQPEQRTVQQYFAKRGLRRPTMNHFGLGYAPNTWSSLLDAMRAKGYTQEELLLSGLALRSDNGRVYDRFRNRVMFPIIDVRGNVIAFGGRVMDDSKPKYLNSPETPIFHKSRNLFALNLAKATKRESFILAEGYMDVIALHQAGFDSAVASLGTSLTEEQARLLSRYTNELILSYDADTAGQIATQRAISILKKCDLRVRVVQIPGAKDPDEYIREKGADAFQVVLDRSAADNTYQLERLAANYDLEAVEGRVQFLQDAARMLAAIDSSVEREVYIGKAAAMAGVDAKAMQNEVKQAVTWRKKQQRTAEKHRIRAATAQAQPKERDLAYTDMKSAKTEESIVQLFFADQTILAQLEKKLPADWFSSPTLRKIYEYALELDHAGQMVDILSFEPILSTGELNLLSRILDNAVLPEKQQLENYINIIRLQRLRDGTLQEGGEDPLLTYRRMKNQNAGGQTI